MESRGHTEENGSGHHNHVHIEQEQSDTLFGAEIGTVRSLEHAQHGMVVSVNSTHSKNEELPLNTRNRYLT